MNNNLKFCQLKVLFKTTNKLKNYFPFKGLAPETLRSNRVSCGSCTVSYIGKTYRYMEVRVSEHIGVSSKTGDVIIRQHGKILEYFGESLMNLFQS